MLKVKLRPFQDEDLEVFKKWLDKPHVAKWYTPPEAWINEIEERHTNFSWVQHFIIEVAGQAIGFCQYYDYALGGETWHHEADVSGAYSIDYMIGEEDYLGKGYGTESMRALIKEVKKHTPAKRIIVQPERHNKASRNTLLSGDFLYDEANDVYYKNL